MKEYLILHMIALTAGIITDILIGDPHNMPHPVRAIGTLISTLEKMIRGDGVSGSKLIFRGAILWIATVSATLIAGTAVIFTSYRLAKPIGVVIEAVLTFYILAAGSLRDESMKVYSALTAKTPDIKDAGCALSMIVGRDTEVLDESGIMRACVETVAENTSDGVIAPLIYTAIGGPVLGLVYKAVNTMDSMIGYHNEKYEYFGRFAARADDVANFIPSRISAIFMIAAAYMVGFAGEKDRRISGSEAYRIWKRDRRCHKSPNSAQTESACAGALGLRLAGDAVYGGITVKKPFIGDDIRPIEAEDIKRAIKLMFVTEAVCTAVIYTITALILIFP